MDATTLRQLQAPLKQRYKDEPGSAATPLHASGKAEGDGITFTVDGWAGPVRAGLHAATGGDGGDACSGDMLLDAVLGCAGVTLRSVATAMGIEARAITGRASGSFDARGTLGTDREVPVGVTDLVLLFELDTDAEDATLAKLAQLTERYCVVAKSLATPPVIAARRAG